MNLQLLYNQAVGFHQRGNLAQAEQLYLQILADDPSSFSARHLLGVIRFQQGRNTESLELIGAALQTNPNDAEALSDYGNVLKALEHFEGALISYDKALTIKPDYAEALNNRGNTLRKLKRFEDALASYDKALTIKPDYAAALNNRGNTLSEMNRFEEALASYNQALTIKPDSAGMLFNRGNILRDLKRFEEALASFDRALTIKPDSAEALNNRGTVLQGLNRFADALASFNKALAIKPDSAEVLNNHGNTLSELKRFEEALLSYDKALAIKPDYAEALNNRGVTQSELKRFERALMNYEAALAIQPNYAEALYNRGNTLRDLQRFEEALANYDKALAIEPEYAEALNNRGTILQGLKRFEDALASYNKAIVIKPDYAEALYNRGNAFNDQGKLEEAEASYRRALQIKPLYADALTNLALLLMMKGNFTNALNIIKQSLQIQETENTKRIFVDCVTHLRWTKDDSEIRIAITRALTEPWGRPSKLARVSTDFVKLNPDIGKCVARATHAWPRRLSAQDLFGSNGLTALAANQLLHALLYSAPNSDIEMERFLTMARRVMLETATGAVDSGDEVGPTLSFYGALARQCFINEYVFCYTDDEIQQAADLRDALATALEANIQVPALWVVTVAAYFPLYSIPLAARLLDAQWPEPIAILLMQQVREPEEELRLRADIPRLTNVEDEISKLVQSQYEENPYPRWVKTAPAGAANDIIEYLRQKFPLTSFQRHDKRGIAEFLIAGCGTGQHSIETTEKFDGAQVLAVDLSLSSLSYAKRKTRELGLAAIEYAQADLLKLRSLGRSFDVIESVGVLHHLADPFAGWRVLLSLLRPGGFMKLGFYSEAARRPIGKAREFIAERGYEATADEIRRCRQDLVYLDKSVSLGTTINTSDFFSISSCRDLLFHVQEHQMTLTRIDAFLRENSLAFLGFEIDSDVLHAYRQRFPDDSAATNLGQWQIFENDNPDTFVSMYQFWIQKAGDPDS